MNRFSVQVVFEFEMRNLQTPDGFDRERERPLRCLCAGLPQLPPRAAQRAQDLGAVEPLSLAVFAEAHRRVESS